MAVCRLPFVTFLNDLATKSKGSSIETEIFLPISHEDRLFFAVAKSENCLQSC